MVRVHCLTRGHSTGFLAHARSSYFHHAGRAGVVNIPSTLFIMLFITVFQISIHYSLHYSLYINAGVVAKGFWARSLHLRMANI
jgi:hypothetical protein